MSKRILKFVVVGERGAGKTAVIENLLSGKYEIFKSVYNSYKTC